MGEERAMFSIISRNNIPSGGNTGIRMRKCEERGRERETEQISCIQISRVAVRPSALLALAWQNKYAKASNQTSDPPPSSRAKLLLEQIFCWKNTKVTVLLSPRMLDFTRNSYKNVRT